MSCDGATGANGVACARLIPPSVTLAAKATAMSFFKFPS